MIDELNSKLLEHHEKFPLFGLILFTKAHPHIVKVLKDQEYYAALNEVSGDLIMIFATTLFQGGLVTPQPPRHPDPSVHVSYCLEPIWADPIENKEVMSWFNIKDSRELPIFVLFAFENSILCYKKYSLKNGTTQEAFNSLNEVISTIAFELEEKINDRTVSLFGKAKWEVSKLQFKRQLRDVAGVISQFRGITGV
jgi:hypothetical protein